MFKRNPRTWARTVVEFFYPRGGWLRATRYVLHRLRRLPDPAHRISRGIAAGVFVTFTPLFGFHFLFAAALAWVMRGNILAALLATFVGNPLTFPLIAELNLDLGSRFLGLPMDMHLPQVVEAFQHALWDLWHNFVALFTHERADWHGIHRFFWRVFLPYLVGGLVPGLGAALISYGLANPMIAAYQKARIKRLRKRFDKRLAEQRARTEAARAEVANPAGSEPR